MDFNKYVLSGIPFLGGGRDYNGIDCWGLVCLFYKEQLNINLPNYDGEYNYDDSKDCAKAIIRTFNDCGDFVRINNPFEGCIVLCKSENQPLHCGIYRNGGKMLHIIEGQTPNIEELGNHIWTNNNILGFYRYKKHNLST